MPNVLALAPTVSHMILAEKKDACGLMEEWLVSRYGYADAIEDFHRVRRRAALEQLLARLTGRHAELLSYEEVRRRVGEQSRIERGLHEIPLDAIVGSVGRYADFTRTFLPRVDSIQDRWARVKALAYGMTGWAPIEVYQIGDAYFVVDGHHRVSVAREMGMATIPAYVTEVKTKVLLTPDMDPEELVIKAEYADFLKQTHLERTRPEADLTVSEAGAYRTLDEHIQVHRYYMGIEEERPISYEEAAAHWYDVVYRPVVNVIRELGLLQDFPGRTEADLYLWLADHRAELQEALGWDVSSDVAAVDLATQYGTGSQRLLSRVGGRLWNAFALDDFEPGPPPGEWRVHRLATREEDQLFGEILVAINGLEEGWRALEQAIVVAQREGSELRGLHVVAAESEREHEDVQKIRDRFQWHLGEVKVPGKLVVEVGPVPRVLCDRARWNDLVVTPLTYPPGPRALQRLSSGFRSVIQRCSRPILAVPSAPSAMQKPLLAYDGSPKAEEALMVVTYLAARWHLSPVVLTVTGGAVPVPELMARARSYLEAHGVHATYEVKSGAVAEIIIDVAETYQCDFIVMGSYGARPFVEIMLGSVVNQVLRESQIPILICR